MELSAALALAPVRRVVCEADLLLPRALIGLHLQSWLTGIAGAVATATATAITLVAAAQAPLEAQSIAGRVVRSTDGAPILGVVVLLLDGAELVRARTLSDIEGRFVVRAPSPGKMRWKSWPAATTTAMSWMKTPTRSTTT